MVVAADLLRATVLNSQSSRVLPILNIPSGAGLVVFGFLVVFSADNSISVISVVMKVHHCTEMTNQSINSSNPVQAANHL